MLVQWNITKRKTRLITDIKQAMTANCIIIISVLHHYECVAPLATSNLQSERFLVILTASVNVRLWYSRSFRTVFIHVIRGWLGGLFQSSGESAVWTFLASALSSNREKKLIHKSHICTIRNECNKEKEEKIIFTRWQQLVRLGYVWWSEWSLFQRYKNIHSSKISNQMHTQTHFYGLMKENWNCSICVTITTFL